MKQKVLVFGGAFSPPTLAHEAIIAECLALPDFDQVWLMPSGDRADKKMSATDEHRLQMLRLVRQAAFKDDARLHVTDFELQLPRPSSTYNTVQTLARAHPDHTFWWALGADSYLSMPSWPNGAELQKLLTNLVLIARERQAQAANDTVIHLQISDAHQQTSSTLARHGIQQGTVLSGMLSAPILNYIQQNGLYR